jgi:hypothetical protein
VIGLTSSTASPSTVGKLKKNLLRSKTPKVLFKRSAFVLQYKSRSPVRTFHRQPFNFSADGRPLSIAAETRAETVFQPIVEARTKAERLKSTLGVFERSKFL